ncbi:MAG: hypothetical protein OEZ28_14200 [Nitrospinota bacterium]|nr:hypothetical protein [Nitrospinota bacterium]
MNKGLLAVALFFAVLAFPLIYNGASAVTGMGKGSPVLEKGKGEKCVKETDWMRRNHMNMLKHTRDDSVRDGVPAGESGLAGCVSCHPKRGEFCDSCHSFVGASPECWRCHHYPV